MCSQDIGPSVVVRHHKAIEAPLIAEDLVLQPRVCTRRDAIDRVVRTHNMGSPTFLNASFERRHVCLPHVLR